MSVAELRSMLHTDGLPVEVLEALTQHEIDLKTLAKITGTHLSMLNLKVSHLIKLETWLSSYRAKEEAQRLKISRSNFKTCALANWPLLNVFTEMFGAFGRDAIHDFDTFDKFVQVIALLGGLTMSVSIGLTTSVSFDELLAFEERVDAGGYWDESGGYGGKEAIEGFAQEAILSFNLLGGSIFMVVIAYVCSFTLKFSDSSLAAWWSVMRVVLFLAFTMLVSGCALTMAAFRRLVEIKFPAYGSIFSTANACMLLMGPGAAIFSLLLSSWALHRKDRSDPEEDAIVSEKSPMIELKKPGGHAASVHTEVRGTAIE